MGNKATANILAALRTLLRSDQIEIGERLPSERALAEQLTCSRETLRRALRTLERENEVWRHVGQGTFRGPRPAAAPLKETLQLQATSVQELVQARLLIEPVVSAEAARRATQTDVNKLQACVENGRNGRDIFECQQADDIFHRTIAEVAKNTFLFSILTFLSDARRRSPWQMQWNRTYRHFGLREFKEEHSNEHARIVDAIEKGNPGQAEIAMRSHLETIIHALEQTPGSPAFSQRGD